MLAVDGKLWYTDGQPSADIMRRLVARNDRQIMSLEIIAIMLALSTFQDELAGRSVILWSDNTGACVCVIHYGCNKICSCDSL